MMKNVAGLVMRINNVLGGAVRSTVMKETFHLIGYEEDFSATSEDVSSHF